MGFLDRLLGREPREQFPQQAYEAGPAYQPVAPLPGQGTPSEDERAIARYRYLLRTAPPEALEQVHAEAFATLTPEQRQQVLEELSRSLPPGEQAPSADPRSMARAATRAELRNPGYLEQTFSRGRFGGGGLGMGGTIMGSMMGTIAGVVIGSAIAGALFDGYDSSPEAAEVGEASEGGGAEGQDAGGADQADAGAVDGGEAGAGDVGGGLAGGGDWGGGGFGGGDFGGGDF
jgi:hypothetical protein